MRKKHDTKKKKHDMINKKELTLKEFKELHSQRQSKTLTPFERYKIMCVLKNPTQENILIHLYTKFLYFGMKEFNQRRFDIQIGVGSYSERTITRNLNSLERKGYFTQEFKKVKGKQYKRLHFNINIEKMHEFLSTGEELEPENFSGLIETLRRQNEDIKPNPYAKTHKPIDNPKDDVLDNNTDSKTIEPAVETKTVSDEHIPIEPTIKPKNGHEEVDKEITNPTKENKNNDNNITKTEDFMKEKVREEDFNEMTKLFMKYKDIEGIKPVLKDLMLSFDTINYLYSNDYVAGVDKRLDDKKATLDILYDMRIKGLINK